jgi:fibronectin-binding autotransporter adhesin
VVASSGVVSNAANVTVGGAVGNTVLDLSGVLGGTYLFAGNTSNAQGAVYQSAGNLKLNGGSVDGMDLGNAANSFGYYRMNDGAATVAGVCVGGEATSGAQNFSAPAGNGIFELNGGTFADTGWFVLARQNGGAVPQTTGILNVFSGLLTYAGGGIVGPWNTNQTAIINILGGVVTNTASVGVYLGNNGNTAGILNLNGGLLQASIVTGYNGPSYGTVSGGQLNFNGGTLRASIANTNFVSVNNASIYSGGATIDNNGRSVTIAQNLLAPAGNGVPSATISSGGAGYIAPPIVTITNAAGDTTGYGATAIAQIDRDAGTVTNIIITCPGQNYSAAPSFVLTGGGASTQATVASAAPAANTSGGLTKNGSGVLTLTGVNTFSGGVTVNAGTLQISSDSQLGAVPASPAVNITLNGGTLYNNNSAPVLNANRTISLGASGGYLQAGWAPLQSIAVNGLITGAGGLGINWDSAAVYLNAANTYQGDTVIGTAGPGYWVNASANPTLKLGVDNALPYGSNKGNLVFGTSANSNTGLLDLNGHNAQINGLTGGSNATIDNTAGAGIYTLTVGNNNATSSFDGVIKNTAGTVALTKAGAGTLTLSGANTYTGNTTISAGTLELAQSVAVLATNSTVSILSGATLKLDNAAVTNWVTALVTNGVSAGNGLYSNANSSGFITGSGYLQVGALVVGPSGPEALTNNFSAGELQLSWPAGKGWRLQMQTNSLSLGLGTNWVYVTDGNVSSTNITVDPTKPTVFYRLRYP